MAKKTKKTKKRSRGGASYPCPQRRCGSPTHVVITRRDEDKNVLRVRECTACGHKFQTLEEKL